MFIFLVLAIQTGICVFADVSGGEPQEHQLSRILTGKLRWQESPHFSNFQGVGTYVAGKSEYLNTSIQDLFEKDVGTLFEGDIVLPHNSNAGDGERKKRQALRDKKYPDNTWKDGVYYQFDTIASWTLRDSFERAAKAWSQDTCVNFIKQTPYVEEGLIVTPLYPVCASEVGRVREWQALYLGRGCESFGEVAHEIGHMLGLAHTMARQDRDKYIVVDTINIDKKYAEQFKKKPQYRTYGVSYDYGSIMHYRHRSGHSKGDFLIIPVDSKYRNTLGSDTIAFTDLTMINRHYNCTEKCTAENSVKCENGGYPHPRNCSRCLCPGGYGGIHCNERPSDDCGQELEANGTWQYLNINIANNHPENYLDDYKRCNYWIKSPYGTKIQLELETIVFEGRQGCRDDGVEIKVKKDPTITGYRFCDYEEDLRLTSHSNIVPIIAYSKVYHRGRAVIKYRVHPKSTKSYFHGEKEEDDVLV